MSQGSAKKRYRQNEREQVANNFLQVRARTALKNARNAIANRTEEAEGAVRQFSSLIDRAARRGGVHRKKAARLNSRLASKLVR